MEAENQNTEDSRQETVDRRQPITGRDYGLSRKSNVAIAAIAGLAAVQQSKAAVVAIILIALVSITYQAILDWFDKDDEY